MFGSTTPLAWKNLTANKKQMLLACGGIGFAVVLMSQASPRARRPRWDQKTTSWGCRHQRPQYLACRKDFGQC
jgi:hypothetical protein